MVVKYVYRERFHLLGAGVRRRLQLLGCPRPLPLVLFCRLLAAHMFDHYLTTI